MTSSRLPGSSFVRMSAADYNKQMAGGALTASRIGRKSSRTRVQAEEMLHRACFEWVFRQEHAHPALRWVFHTPSGGARSKGEGGKLKAMGARKGVVDVISPFPAAGGPGLAIEIKAPKAKATPEQKEFLERAASCGWVHGVCYGLEEFQALVRQYLGVSPDVRMA